MCLLIPTIPTSLHTPVDAGADFGGDETPSPPDVYGPAGSARDRDRVRRIVQADCSEWRMELGGLGFRSKATFIR